MDLLLQAEPSFKGRTFSSSKAQAQISKVAQPKIPSKALCVTCVRADCAGQWKQYRGGQPWRLLLQFAACLVCLSRALLWVRLLLISDLFCLIHRPLCVMRSGQLSIKLLESLLDYKSCQWLCSEIACGCQWQSFAVTSNHCTLRQTCYQSCT